jgi:hypothetical protein
MGNIDWERIENLRAVGRFVYGFSLDEDNVFFLQDFTQADFVHDANTGARFHFAASGLGDEVFLAGEFNGWQQIQMGRAPRVSTQFGLSLPLSRFAGTGKQFKFVANGHLWIEPPDFASNVADAGWGDPSTRNLVLVEATDSSRSI